MVGDEDPWQKMFVRQFFVPFHMPPGANNQFVKNDYHDEHIRDSYDSLGGQDDTSITGISDVDSSSKYRNHISDFGASYGFYPVGLAIFTDGVQSNTQNEDSNDTRNVNLLINDDNVRVNKNV